MKPGFTLGMTDQQIIDAYAAAARVIHLYLAEFCDETLTMDQMIANASRRAVLALSAERSARERAERAFYNLQIGERDGEFTPRASEGSPSSPAALETEI